MKRKITYIITIIILVILSGCASIKSSEEVSLVKTEGRKQLVVNYNRNLVRSVRIKNIILDSGVPYYLEPGEYRMSYQETPMINGIFDFSYRSSRNDDRDHDGRRSHLDRPITTYKIIDLQEDTVVEIEGKTFGISTGVRINSKKTF